MQEQRKAKLVVVSMYDGQGNESLGQPAILDFAANARYDEIVLVDVRQGEELPGIGGVDAVIVTGGPGNPNDTAGWGPDFKKFTHDILQHNAEKPANPIGLLGICHGFQVFCIQNDIGVALAREEECLIDGTASPMLLGIKEQEIVASAKLIPNQAIQALQTPVCSMESRNFRICLNEKNFINGVMPSSVPKIGFVPFMMRDEKPGCRSLTGIATTDGEAVFIQPHPEAEAEFTAARLRNLDGFGGVVLQREGAEKHREMLENVGHLTQVTAILTDMLARSHPMNRTLALASA